MKKKIIVLLLLMTFCSIFSIAGMAKEVDFEAIMPLEKGVHAPAGQHAVFDCSYQTDLNLNGIIEPEHECGFVGFEED